MRYKPFTDARLAFHVNWSPFPSQPGVVSTRSVYAKATSFRCFQDNCSLSYLPHGWQWTMNYSGIWTSRFKTTVDMLWCFMLGTCDQIKMAFCLWPRLVASLPYKLMKCSRFCLSRMKRKRSKEYSKRAIAYVCFARTTENRTRVRPTALHGRDNRSTDGWFKKNTNYDTEK